MIAPFGRLMLASLAPLDAMRALGLRVLGRRAATILRNRARRVGLWSVSGVLLAFALTAVAPLYSLTLGPLFLGVAHLLADIRYLVVRQRLHQRRELLLTVAPLMIAQCWAPSVSLALFTVAAAALCARTSMGPRAVAAALAVALALACSRRPAFAALCFAHAHNLVALALWVAWARRDRKHVVPALALFACGSVLILAGELDFALGSRALAPSHLALDAGLLMHGVASSLDPVFNVRLLLFFAFAQSVHYLVWTRLIPEEDRSREGPRTYRATYAALNRECGAWALLAAWLLAMYFAVRGLVEPDIGRAQYLRFALFHGPLELAAATLFMLEKTPLHDGRAA